MTISMHIKLTLRAGFGVYDSPFSRIPLTNIFYNSRISCVIMVKLQEFWNWSPSSSDLCACANNTLFRQLQFADQHLFLKVKTMSKFEIWGYSQYETSPGKSIQQNNFNDDVIFEFLLMSAKMFSSLENKYESRDQSDDTTNHHLLSRKISDFSFSVIL